MRHACLIVVATLSLAGCGSAEKTVVETEDAKVTTTGNGNYKVQAQDGSSAEITTNSSLAAARAAEIAPQLPAFAPLYPGAKVVSTMSGSDADGASGLVVILETADPFAKVVAFYDEKVAASGASQQMRMDQADSAIRTVADASGKGGAMVSIADGGDARTITITTSTQG